MKIPERADQEGLLEYSERISAFFTENNKTTIRKLRGQFFTPKQVATFMAGLFELHQEQIRLLDPGAGTGILTAAFCDRVLQSSRPINLTIHAYENDACVLPLLKSVMESCKNDLEEKDHSVKYEIINRDFIRECTKYFRDEQLLENKKQDMYDYVISNPPYYKLNKNSPQIRGLEHLVSGQPNIYPFFMALSACMTKNTGEMVFITPRSFCSGLYYRTFRKWFVNNTNIKRIHIFESRKEIFDGDKVLQENIIVKSQKGKKTDSRNTIIITTSKNKDFHDIMKFETHDTDIIYHKNGDVFIRIPSSINDLDNFRIVDSWPNTLESLGLQVSTGPVVPFRAKDYLIKESDMKSDDIPLLWMHNIRDMTVKWPFGKNGKPFAVRRSNNIKQIILPVRDYVLLNRFSSKEQKRRLYAAVLLKSQFPFKTVGIENHINYIYKPNEDLPLYDAFGIAALFNSVIIDNFFRSINGNTQVNATDIRSLPLPNIDNIKRIGKIVYESQSNGNVCDIDAIVNKCLSIDVDIEERVPKTEACING